MSDQEPLAGITAYYIQMAMSPYICLGRLSNWSPDTEYENSLGKILTSNGVHHLMKWYPVGPAIIHMSCHVMSMRHYCLNYLHLDLSCMVRNRQSPKRPVHILILIIHPTYPRTSPALSYPICI